MRNPAVAGRFYPADADSLKDAVLECTGQLGPGGSGRRIRGALAPHAGIMISGPNAANAYRRILEDGLPEVYVIIGPDHHGMLPFNTFSSESFLTPFGECRVHGGVASRLSKLMPDVPEAQMHEHAVEVQLPFIQTIDPDPEIVPIMMSDQSPEAAAKLASDLREACEGVDALFIASTDMSHYVPKETAAEKDGKVIEKIRAMDWKGMYDVVCGERVSMCGYGPTATVMMLCEGCSVEGVLHTDSYDALGLDPGSVVGYCSAVFRKD